MRRRLLVSLATLAVLLGLLEGAVRVRQYVKYGTTGPRVHRLEAHEPSGLLVPKAGSETGSIVVNEDGFRSPPIPREKPVGTVRLAFLGGSTTFCAEVSSNEHTWPHLVVEQLRRRHPGVDFDYLNGGGAGYRTEQSLTNLEHRIAPYDPDVLVVYHGTNDLVHESRAIAVERGLIAPDAREVDGWLARNCMVWYLLRKNLRFQERQSQAEEGAVGMRLEDGAIAASFGQNLGRLLDAAASEAEVVVLPTFATRIRADQSRDERVEAAASALYYMPYFDADQVLEGYAELNATIRAVAAGRPELVLVEGEDAIPADDEHFADTVHFLDAGAELQARRVVEALDAAPAFRTLLRELGS